MPKKGKSMKVSAGGEAAVETGEPETEQERGSAPPPPPHAPPPKPGESGGGSEKTFAASSGRHFAIATEDWPEDGGKLPAEVDIVHASEGDLLEVQLIMDDWAYGKRFKERADVVNEGVFRLGWVRGLKQVMENGQRRPIELDIKSPDYGFQPPRGTDTSTKLRLKRWAKKLEAAQKVWSCLDSQPPAAAEVAAAAKAAAVLEQDHVREQLRKKKAAEKKRKATEKKAAEKKAAQSAAMQNPEAEGEEVRADADPEPEPVDFQDDSAEDTGAVGVAQPASEVPIAEPAASTSPAAVAVFILGQRVQCRDQGDNWRYGTVQELSPVKVRPDGWSSCVLWDEIWPVLGSEAVVESPDVPDGMEAHAEKDVDIDEAVDDGDVGCEGCGGWFGGGTAPQVFSPATRSFPSSPSKNSGSSSDVDAQLGAGAGRRKVYASDAAWEALWEQKAAQLESVLSASSSGAEGSGRKPHGPKKILTGKFARSLLAAKRSGELNAIAQHWEKAHTEMASKASDLSALHAKVRRHVRGEEGEEPLECIAEEMAGLAERKAAELRELKERVFRAMIDMKRTRSRDREEQPPPKEQEVKALQAKSLLKRAFSGMARESRRPQELDRIADEMAERTTSEMDDAQRELETKALQVRSLMKRAFSGMQSSRRPEDGPQELERIADEMAEHFQTKAESVKNKIRKGLLRAHRAGELVDMREELNELGDSVPDAPCPLPPPLPGDLGPALAPGLSSRRRWAEYPSSDSDSSLDPRDYDPRRLAPSRLRPSPFASAARRDAAARAGAEADMSGSDGGSCPSSPKKF